MSRRGARPRVVFVRPEVVLVQAAPFLVMGLVALLMGLLGSGPLGVRLFIAIVIPVFFGVTAAIMVLRAIALARRGEVRAGLGGDWIAIMSAEEIVVEDGVGRWARICVVSGGASHPLITTPGPLWLGSDTRHRTALEEARNELVRSALPTRPKQEPEPGR